VVRTDGWLVLAAGVVVFVTGALPEEPASVVPRKNPRMAPSSRAATASRAAIAHVVSPCGAGGAAGGGVVERDDCLELLRGAGCAEPADPAALFEGVFADGAAEVRPPFLSGPLDSGSSSKKKS
jgi:hypothetical protein